MDKDSGGVFISAWCNGSINGSNPFGESSNLSALVFLLDHKNGINNDNRLENLRFLCPNCNSQTNTFAGRSNLGKGEKYNCKNCGKNIIKGSIHCRECHVLFVGKKFEKTRPSKEELQKMLWEYPATKLAERFGVSDKAIENWSKKYGLKKPSRGYWVKKKYGKV